MYAVIGSGYGDEGKGLTTDWLANKTGLTVCRSNGGAQAGHTVVTPDGKRHIFSHFGSGTFAGSRTRLSKYMIINPIQFRREHQELDFPRISVDPRCLVTIPQDMLINQIKEEARGQGRHGSCGWGIHETMVRPWKLTVIDLAIMSGYELQDMLDHCRSYAPRDCLDDRLWDKNIQRNWIKDLRYFYENVEIEYCPNHDFIFEGAQGLALDQNAPDFPHVTHSNTGLTNIEDLRNGRTLDVYYISRCYTTRHGAGPLAQEGSLVGVDVVDLTNQPNPWQGTLRTAPLNISALVERIKRDLEGKVDINFNMMITCLDQIKGKANVIIDDKTYYLKPLEIVEAVKDMVPAGRIFGSFGPTRETINEY